MLPLTALPPRLALATALLLTLATACQTDTGWRLRAEEPAAATSPRLCRYAIADLARDTSQLAEHLADPTPEPTTDLASDSSPPQPHTQIDTPTTSAEPPPHAEPTPTDVPIIHASQTERAHKPRKASSARPAQPATAASTPPEPTTTAAGPVAARETAAPDARGASPQGCVDLNMATESELRALRGVGPGRAAAIVAARERKPFTKLNQLQRIKGIGKATYARIAPSLCPL